MYSVTLNVLVGVLSLSESFSPYMYVQVKDDLEVEVNDLKMELQRMEGELEQERGSVRQAEEDRYRIQTELK